MISECWFSHLLFYVRNILISGYLFTFLAYCASMFRVLFLQLTLSQWIGVFSGWWIDFGDYLKLCSLVYPKTATQNFWKYAALCGRFYQLLRSQVFVIPQCYMALYNKLPMEFCLEKREKILLDMPIVCRILYELLPLFQIVICSVFSIM